MSAPDHVQTYQATVRRDGPDSLAVYLGRLKVTMAPWIARQLASALLRAAARIDPDFRSKP